jgi:hypothetical protein
VDRLTTPLSQDRMEGLRNLFKAREKTPVEKTPVKRNVLSDVELAEQGFKPTTGSDKFSLKGIMDKWNNLGPGMQTAIVGAGSGALAGVAQWFENQIPQEPGESMEEYIARRKVAVGKLMRQYMDNTRAYDAEWTTMTNEQKDAEVAKYNMNQGGRVGYQTGGITMANTLQENIRRNQAQAAANEGVFQAARDKLINKYVDQPSILGPATQQAAKTMIDRNLESEAALDMLNKTSMSPTGTVDTGIMTQAPTTRPTMADVAGPSITAANTTGITQQDPFKLNQLQVSGAVTLDEALNYAKRRGDPQSYLDFLRRDYENLGGTPIDFLVREQKYKDASKSDITDELTRVYNQILPQYRTFDTLDKYISDYYTKFPYYNQGGRVGLKHGTPEMGIKSLDAGAPDITYEGNEGPQAPQQMAGMMDQISLAFEQQNGYDMSLATPEVREIFIKQWMQENFYEKESRGPVLPSPEDPINPFAPKPTGPVLPNKMMAAKGGRIGQMIGTGPNGLPGIPRMAPDGMEFDMRQNGGFQPLGAKEKKDDVPAMLAKNEFVFTADAVRGAGDGDIEKGAQRMYDTMQKLEKRVV